MLDSFAFQYSSLFLSCNAMVYLGSSTSIRLVMGELRMEKPSWGREELRGLWPWWRSDARIRRWVTIAKVNVYMIGRTPRTASGTPMYVIMSVAEAMIERAGGTAEGLL